MTRSILFVLVSFLVACTPSKYRVDDVVVSRPDGGSDSGTPDGGNTPDGGGNTTDGGDASCTESDLGCGYNCAAKCAVGKKCNRFDDCVTGICANSVCSAPTTPSGPTCSDLARNGNETDVDCGGSCSAKCGNGAACVTDGDCSTGLNCSAQRCTAPTTPTVTCSDGIKNGSESDIDCGGSCSAKCAAGYRCVLVTDCSTGICAGGFCALPNTPTPVCNRNSVKDGNESDIDCGGNACGPCADGKSCLASTDCSSQRCNNGTCEAASSNPLPSCSNLVRDGTESDVDCGGTCVAKCGNTFACIYASDCSSGVCNNGRCGTNGTTPPVTPATCNNNGVKDSNETGVDCGGGSYDAAGVLIGGCGGCAKDVSCQRYLDCASRICDVAGGSKCVGEPITPPGVVTNPVAPSGTFLVTAVASIPAASNQVRIDWTAQLAINTLHIRKGAAGSVEEMWHFVEGSLNDGLSGHFFVENVVGSSFSFRLRGHAIVGQNGESATSTIQLPANTNTNGTTTFMPGMAPAGNHCYSMLECASKTCNNGTCGVVSGSPYGLQYAIVPRPGNWAGSVDITYTGPNGTQTTNAQQSRAILINPPNFCDPNVQGVNGPNEFLRYTGCSGGHGCDPTYVQVILPLSGGIVYGTEVNEGEAIVGLSQLECWRVGY